MGYNVYTTDKEHSYEIFHEVVWTGEELRAKYNLTDYALKNAVKNCTPISYNFDYYIIKSRSYARSTQR